MWWNFRGDRDSSDDPCINYDGGVDTNSGNDPGSAGSKRKAFGIKNTAEDDGSNNYDCPNADWVANTNGNDCRGEVAVMKMLLITVIMTMQIDIMRCW